MTDNPWRDVEEVAAEVGWEARFGHGNDIPPPAGDPSS